MRKTVIKKDDYIKFYNVLLFGRDENIIEKSIDRAYRDMCRTLKGFSQNKNHDQIYDDSVRYLSTKIDTLLRKEKMNQDLFDKWHKETCDELKKTMNNQKITYGQAQKWINMSLKYLSVLDHDKTINTYEYYHIPIDSIILNETKYKKINCAWSKIDDYNKYIEFQKWFREKYKGIPLDEEFMMWLRSK